MNTKNTATLVLASALAAAAIAAGCGGGGGGYSAPPPPPTPPPSPSPSPGLTGTLNVATGGTVAGGFTYTPVPSTDIAVFTCGCSNQAGITSVGASGSFAVTSPASPTPAAPNPTYTIVPTRNYIAIGEPSSGAGPQAWTIVYAGTIASHDLALGDTGTVPASSGTSDVYTAAAALYIYKFSTQNSKTAFDDWNITTVQSWITNKLFVSPNAAETTLLNDIASLSASGTSLFPTKPGWNSGQPISAKINGDLASVNSSGDGMLPTPCPGGEGTCTGTPAP